MAEPLMHNRRQFLTGSLATLGAAAMPAGIEVGWRAETRTNLVPATPATSPSYWCTWSAQNYMYGRGAKELDVRLLEGERGNRIAREQINEQVLLGPDGWAIKFYPSIRRDLYLLLDDGWAEGGPASFLLDEKKFPSFKKGTPPERLRQLNDAIRGLGWRGLALWCRDTPGGKDDERLVLWSEDAGIHYWKIDGGDKSFNVIRARNRAHAALTLEHIYGEPPVNGDWRRNGRFGQQLWGSQRIDILRQTDIYRTYDTTSILSIPTTLDRVSELFLGAAGHEEVRAILNAEDEVYIAAALGCTMGIMRHPLIGMRPEHDADLFFNGPRQAKRRMDEAVRAVRWQRIAPPFSPGFGSVKCSDEILTDSWIFERGQTWQKELLGTSVRQGAPACLARNIALPEIKAPNDKPFVVAAKFPNGAVAIAAHERTQVGNAWYMPACEVTLSVSDAPGPFGVFGHFDSLTLICDKPLSGKRVLAQDLARDASVDVSNEVQIRGTSLQIPGRVMRRVCHYNRPAGDLSAPGLVIAIV